MQSSCGFDLSIYSAQRKGKKKLNRSRTDTPWHLVSKGNTMSKTFDLIKQNAQ